MRLVCDLDVTVDNGGGVAALSSGISDSCEEIGRCSPDVWLFDDKLSKIPESALCDIVADCGIVVLSSASRLFSSIPKFSNFPTLIALTALE